MTVSELVAKLQDEGWKFLARTQYGVTLYQSFYHFGSGIFEFKVEIETVNATMDYIGDFSICSLYGPPPMANGLMQEQKPVAKWTTSKGAAKGVSTAFDKAFTALQNRVGKLEIHKGKVDRVGYYNSKRNQA